MVTELPIVGERLGKGGRGQSGRICNLAVMGCVFDVRGNDRCIKHGKVANPTTNPLPDNRLEGGDVFNESRLLRESKVVIIALIMHFPYLCAHPIETSYAYTRSSEHPAHGLIHFLNPSAANMFLYNTHKANFPFLGSYFV